MKHWMMWIAGLSLVLGAVTAAPATAAEKAASSKSAVSKQAAAAAVPTEEWAVTAVTKEGGGFDYCAAGTRFDNKHALLVARNKADEMIVIVGLPTDKLKTKTLLPTKLMVDGRETRQGSGLVTRPSALAVMLGKDTGFFESIRRGNTLSIDNPELNLSVSLRGSGRALGDLRSCVETEGKSVAKILPVADSAAPETPASNLAAAAAPEQLPTLEPINADAPLLPMVSATPPMAAAVAPAVEAARPAAPVQQAALPPSNGPVASGPVASAAAPFPATNPAVQPASSVMAPVLPDALVSLLSAAGMAGVVPVSLDRVPTDQRPANFAWRYGDVFGGIKEISIIDDRDLASLTTAYIEAIRNSCGGEFKSSFEPVEQLREITLRTGDASCTTPERRTEFRHIYYINKARIFTVFIHEGDAAGAATAGKARDALAGVIRQLATTGTVGR
jgi:hypothetical protein